MSFLCFDELNFLIYIMFMKLFFFHNTSDRFPWIGDKTSIEVIIQGLKELNIPCYLGKNIEESYNYDFVFLSAICCDLNPLKKSLELLQKNYGVIPFQEDYLNSSGAAFSFFGYVKNALLSEDCNERLQALYEQPELIRYIPFEPKKYALINHEVLKNARLCIANSKTEEKTIKRDCKNAVTEVVPWTPGLLFEKNYPYDDAFLDWIKLPPKSYILHIGRFEPRKNQLASILATRHLDIPLVFIASSSFDGYREYALTCLEAIQRLRKAPTIIISGTMPSQDLGLLKIIGVDQTKGLSPSLLISSYQNAGLYLHPAFYELPGYVNLEAAKLGTPCIATEWSTLRDYFTSQEGKYELDDRILYSSPYDINRLEKQILIHFGRYYEPGSHPSFFRKPNDVAKDFVKALQKHYYL